MDGVTANRNTRVVGESIEKPRPEELRNKNFIQGRVSKR
jgi:hypothetical protein